MTCVPEPPTSNREQSLLSGSMAGDPCSHGEGGNNGTWAICPTPAPRQVAASLSIDPWDAGLLMTSILQTSCKKTKQNKQPPHRGDLWPSTQQDRGQASPRGSEGYFVSPVANPVLTGEGSQAGASCSQKHYKRWRRDALCAQNQHLPSSAW